MALSKNWKNIRSVQNKSQIREGGGRKEKNLSQLPVCVGNSGCALRACRPAAHATTRRLPSRTFHVRYGGSAQTAFRGDPAIRFELRAARTSLSAYVRLLLAQPHCMLRACAPGHLRPTPRTSSHVGSASKSRFSLR